MTTDSQLTRPLPGAMVQDPQVRAVGLVATGCLVIGAAAVGVAWLAADPAAVRGAATGAAIAVGIFVSGAVVVALVSRLLPALSLLVAMVTYLCQVVLAIAIFVRIDRSDALVDGTLSGGWLAAVLVLCTLFWMAALVRSVATSRVPLYDLGEGGAR